MSVNRLLEAHEGLEAELLLLLNLQLARGFKEIPTVDALHTLLDDYGRAFVVYYASTYLESEDGRSDLRYIMAILEAEMKERKTCFESRRSCPCKHVCRQECDALIDLSLRMLQAVLEVVKYGAEEMEEDILVDG